MDKLHTSTGLLYAGKDLPGMDNAPEALPLYQTSAFTSRSLDEVQARYAGLDTKETYSYIRSSNPNRESLASIISYLEGGEDSIITSAGMGAITSTLLALLKSGDHIIYSNCCYGETLEIMTELFEKFGVEVSGVNIDDLDEVKAAIRSNTKIIYTEVVANPLMRVADIDALAEMAHEIGALLIVDNTFTTPFAIKPLEHGADIVINSLTKFLNGHSDACAGVVTTTKERIQYLKHVISFCGTPGDPFSAWMVARSMMTSELRITRQMSNAAKIAKALSEHPMVERVHHPCIEGFSGYETGKKLFKDDESMCGMLSFVINTEDYEKRNAFSKALKLIRYAPTLGGVRTTYQQPVFSSQAHMPDDERRKMGITPGMFRISVGIEDSEDIIADLFQALSVIA